MGVFFIFSLGAFILSFSSNVAIASMSPPSPECFLIGKVTEQSKRKSLGSGMSDGKVFTYHDVAIYIKKMTFVDPSRKDNFGVACDRKQYDTTEFQLRDVSILPPDLLGKCISAKSKFSGDGNFKSGNWLYDIEILNDSECP